jgi:hypothetical protein
MDWKVPKSFKVFTREFITKEMDEGGMNEGESGSMLLDPAMIQISPLLEPESTRQKITWAHEMLHAVLDSMGIKMKHRHLDAMAAGIVQVLDTAEGDYNAPERL